MRNEEQFCESLCRREHVSLINDQSCIILHLFFFTLKKQKQKKKVKFLHWSHEANVAKHTEA